MVRNPPQPNTFTSALDAIYNLCDEALVGLDSAATTILLAAHSEIKRTDVRQKNAAFFRNYYPLRNQLITLLADHYRRLFKLALAHPRQTENDPDRWVTIQLQPALNVAFEWIREWYILACEGENQSVRILATQEVVQAGTISIPIPTTVSQLPPAASWRAPTWLFGVSLALFGIGQMKHHHLPQTDTEERLGEAHTRLLLKGARRTLLWDLAARCRTVRNEELVAAGTSHSQVSSGPTRPPNKRKGWQQKHKLYDCIRKVLTNPGLQGIEFCAELDKRHAPPLYDWIENGEWRDGLTWKEAWSDPKLRDRIRRVRQEAQKTT